MTITHCIFDIGDVCYPYSSEPLNMYCRGQSKDKVKYDLTGGSLSFDYKPFEMGTMDFTQFCKELCLHCDIPYSLSIEKEINTKMHEGVGAFFPETLALIDILKQRKIEVCFLSNALPNLADTFPELTTPDKCFLSYNLGLIKPDPQIYKAVLKALNVLPQQVIFIDDKKRNVDVARNLEINGIVFHRETVIDEVLSLL